MGRTRGGSVIVKRSGGKLTPEQAMEMHSMIKQMSHVSGDTSPGGNSREDLHARAREMINRGRKKRMPQLAKQSEVDSRVSELEAREQEIRDKFQAEQQEKENQEKIITAALDGLERRLGKISLAFYASCISRPDQQSQLICKLYERQNKLGASISLPDEDF